MTSAQALTLERRQALAERQQQAEELESYDGGFAIAIGSGVVLVALAIVAVIAVTD